MRVINITNIESIVQLNNSPAFDHWDLVCVRPLQLSSLRLHGGPYLVMSRSSFSK